MTSADRLERIALLQYGFLAVPLAFAGLPLYIHAPDFYATQAGLSLSTIGLIILCVRMFDAIQDPVIGLMSQKYAAFRPVFITGSILLMAAGFIMLFYPPSDFTGIWFAFSLILATTAFSVITINFNALGSLWSDDSFQKTRITTWREALGLAGLLVAAILPAVISLQIYAYILALLAGAAGVLFYRWNKKHRDIIAQREGAFRPARFKALCTRENGWFFATYFASMLASSIPAVLVIFFIRDRLDAESLTGLFLLLYFLSGVAGMPLWQALSRTHGKFAAWLVSMLVAVAAFIWAYFLGPGDVWAYGAICVFSGMALGAELALPPAILSSMLDRQGETRQTPLYFSLLAFLFKVALAAGSGLAFLMLGFSSFVPAAENSAAALTTLSFTYALLPCLIKITAALSILLWMKRHIQGDHHAFSAHTVSHGGHNGT